MSKVAKETMPEEFEAILKNQKVEQKKEEQETVTYCFKVRGDLPICIDVKEDHHNDGRSEQKDKEQSPFDFEDEKLKLETILCETLESRNKLQKHDLLIQQMEIAQLYRQLEEYEWVVFTSRPGSIAE